MKLYQTELVRKGNVICTRIWEEATELSLGELRWKHSIFNFPGRSWDTCWRQIDRNIQLPIKFAFETQNEVV